MRPRRSRRRGCSPSLLSATKNRHRVWWRGRRKTFRKDSLFFLFPSDHWRRIRTSNVLERINREIRRRTRVATIFPNDASCLRLISAVLMEISEEWETGRIYLTM
nr:transposase [Desulfuromonas soudanensis]